MSMPKLEQSDKPIEREQSVSNLVESVALMETGLSHILNAEGEKIQKVIRADDPSADIPIDNIMKVNESVNKMVNSITKLEMMLQSKLETSKNLDNPIIIPESGTIIPYTGYVHLASAIDGSPLQGGLLNFAYIPLTTSIPLGGIVDTVEVPHNVTAFSIPRDVTITSMSFFCNVIDLISIADDTQIVARVYVTEPYSTTYNALEDAIVYLNPKVSSGERIETTGHIDGLDIKLLANTKIVLLFYIYAPASSEFYAICGGSLNLK